MLGPNLYELWDVGEFIKTRPPNLSNASLARVMKALLFCGGKLLSSYIQGDISGPARMCDVLYRIALSPGSKDNFEELSGYSITKPDDIRGQ